MKGKYQIKDGKLHDVKLDEPIPDDEPVFILRARDALSAKLIGAYRAFCVMNDCPQDHLDNLREVVGAFRKWQEKNIHTVRMGGTTRTKDERIQPMPVADLPQWVEVKHPSGMRVGPSVAPIITDKDKK